MLQMRIICRLNFLNKLKILTFSIGIRKMKNYFKLVLNKRDQEVFANLLRDINDDILTEKSNILLNYYFFKKENSKIRKLSF